MDVLNLTGADIIEYKDNPILIRKIYHLAIEEIQKKLIVTEDEIQSEYNGVFHEQDIERLVSDKYDKKKKKFNGLLRSIIVKCPSIFTKDDLIKLTKILASTDYTTFEDLAISLSLFNEKDIKEYLAESKKVSYVSDERFPVLTEVFAASLIRRLKKQNKLNIKFFQYILDTFNETDSYDMTFLQEQLDDFISMFNDEELNLIMKYGINPIFYLDDSRITQEMIDMFVNSKSVTIEQIPSIITSNRKYVKTMIKNNPILIQYSDYILDDELRNIALENGYQYTEDDYQKHDFLDSKLALAMLEKYVSQWSTQYSGKKAIKIMRFIEKEYDENFISCLINKIVKYNLLTPEIAAILNSEDFVFPLLDTGENTLELYKDLLSNYDTSMKILKGMGHFLANNVQFKITSEFIQKFYECNFCIYSYSNENIFNSQELYLRAFDSENLGIISSTIIYGKKEFLTKELLLGALEKGYDPISNSGLDVTDSVLDQEVKKVLCEITNFEYKVKLQEILRCVGNTIVYIEKDNLLSKEMIDIFGVPFIIKIIRNLRIPGKKMDFRNIIDKGCLNQFKQYYEMFKISEDVRDFYFLYENYEENIELVTDLLNNGITESEKEKFKQYIYQKDKLCIISSREKLMDLYFSLYDTNEYILMNLENYDDDNKLRYLKIMILSSLFNLSEIDVNSLLGIISVSKIQSLKSCITDQSMINLLDSYLVIMDYVEYINQLNNISELTEIAQKVTKALVEEPDLFDLCRNITRNMEIKSKEIYTYELNAHLSSLNRFDVIKTKIHDTDVTYIECSEDSYFLAHVMNAFGSGSKLEDFKNPRFIGKTYICLTGIGRGVEPYEREEKDMHYVTLLFNSVLNGSLISMSNRDMASNGAFGDLDVNVRNDFAPFEMVLDNTKFVNEYVLYREVNGNILYPSAVLVVGDVPSLEEIRAAEFLNIPLVKRKKVKKIQKQNYDNKTMDDEFVVQSLVETFPKELMELYIRLNAFKGEQFKTKKVL